VRILVTGSRDWDDWRTISLALIDWADARSPVTIVQGCAKGADYLAAQAARKLLWGVEDHPADWDKHGVSAGIIRNLEMVKAGADVCLAFIRNNSRGATHCADAAERAGIPTFRYLYRDDEGGASVREPRRSGPDRPPAGEPGVPGGSDDHKTATPAGDTAGSPYASISLSPIYVSPDCMFFYEVPEGTSIQDFLAELREPEAAIPS
jgi:YspA, cpYpsA-related SLOG family